MFFIAREREVTPHTIMNRNEMFIDVGANVDAYPLQITAV